MSLIGFNINSLYLLENTLVEGDYRVFMPVASYSWSPPPIQQHFSRNQHFSGVIESVRWFADILENLDTLPQLNQEITEKPYLERNETIKIQLNNKKYNETPKKYTSCVICSDEFKNEEYVSVLSCGHVFHPSCISEWGHYKSECPLCKQPIPTEKENLDGDK